MKEKPQSFSGDSLYFQQTETDKQESSLWQLKVHLHLVYLEYSAHLGRI